MRSVVLLWMGIVLLAGVLPATGWASGPAGDLRAAVADLRQVVPATDWPHTRYISLRHWPVEERAEVAAVVSFVLNSVSRAELLVIPRLDDTGTLLRVNLADYELPADVWELLASRDPYWHQQVAVQAIGPKKASQTLATFTDGGWVGLSNAATLRELTGSAGAVLRGDYFVTRASSTLNGGVYYQLAGVPPRELDFFALLGLDVRTIDKLRADAGANMIFSRVTHKVRRVVRRPGPLGGAWHTYDVLRSTPERDPLRNPFAFEYDASEHIAAKQNGLHLFALYDRQGARQDSVPDQVAKDSSDLHGAGIVVPMISCVRCHVEDGLRPFGNDQQRLLQGKVELYVAERADARRLAAFYLADLGKPLSRDQEDYANAVSAATGGMSVSGAAGALAEVVAEYQDQLVTPVRAAAELDVELTVLKARLRAATDPVLLALVEGLSVQREQWDAVFGQAALLVMSGEQ